MVSKFRPPLNRTHAVLSLCLMLLMASGCGFQPRGQAGAVGDLPATLYFTGIGRYSELHIALTRQLALAGSSVADSPADADAVVHIGRYRAEARVLTLDGRNRAVEIELEESAYVQVRGKEAAADPDPVRVLRIQYQPSDEILPRQRESEQVRDDMRDDLARRILRRVAAQY